MTYDRRIGEMNDLYIPLTVCGTIATLNISKYSLLRTILFNSYTNIPILKIN